MRPIYLDSPARRSTRWHILLAATLGALIGAAAIELAGLAFVAASPAAPAPARLERRWTVNVRGNADGNKTLICEEARK